MKKIIIAIDGYSSTGKSTFAKAIASMLGYIFVDTGAMYRAVTLYAMRHGIADEPSKIAEALDDINIEFRYNPAIGRSEIYLNGENVDEAIRSVGVNDKVSAVSQIPQVREKLVAIQKELGRTRGLVMDGRDIGTVVFPDAEIKIFMTADPKVRSQRRYRELKAMGADVSPEEIEENIEKRDRQDETRAVSPLRRAPDALLLDNSRMTPGQQMEWFLGVLAKFE